MNIRYKLIPPRDRRITFAQAIRVLCVITCYIRCRAARYLHDLSVMGFSKVSREISINAAEIMIPRRAGSNILFRSAAFSSPLPSELIILSLFIIYYRRSVSRKTRVTLRFDLPFRLTFHRETINSRNNKVSNIRH